MRISLHWLNELVNITNIELETLIEKLTLGGFEVEDVLNLILNAVVKSLTNPPFP